MALVVWVPSCGGPDPDPAPDVEGPKPVSAWRVELLLCPGDQVWEEAIQDAEVAENLDGLERVAAESLQTCSGRWEVHWALGEIRYKRDYKTAPEQLERIVENWRLAATAAEAAQDPAGVSRTASRLGMYFRLQGDFAAAERQARLAIDAAGTAGRDDLRGLAHNTLAGIYYTQARFGEAVDSMDQAAASFKRAGSERSAVSLEINQSMLLEDLGQLARERRLLEGVHADAVRLGLDESAQRAALVMGNLHLLYREYGDAQRWFERVPAAGTQGDRVALGRGRIALGEGRYADAIGQLNRAAGTTDPALRLWIRRVLGQAQMLAGRTDAAVHTLQSVIGESQAIGATDTEALAQALLGKCLIRMGDPRAALEPTRRAVELIETSGAGLSPSDAVTFLRERYEPYVELAALLVETGQATLDQVLGVVESAHARALRQLLRAEQDPAIDTPTVASLQRRLAPGELLLDYLIGEDRGVRIAMTASTAHAQLLPGWNELRPALDAYRAALRRPLESAEARADPMADLRRDLAHGARLRDLLLAGLEDVLGSSTRVYVVPDQDLALLPLAALPDVSAGESRLVRFLGERVAVASLPLAAVPRQSRAAAGALLLAGDPTPDAAGEFAELPLAAAELQAIARVWSGRPTTRLERARWTRDNLAGLSLETFETLHLATHAVASSRDPERCAVILSGGERLGVDDLAALRLGPGLVVLSACRTGGGEIVPGEGVVGLTWAFLRAGARGVVASLWTVEDAATRDLMVALHENLRNGADSVSALQLAQATTRAKHPHPAFWSPFVIMLAPIFD